METSTEQIVSEEITPLALQRLWARRLNGANLHEETDIGDLLLDHDVFPSAQFDENLETGSKSRTCSPSPFQVDQFLCIEQELQEDVPGSFDVPGKEESFEDQSLVLYGALLKDIPAIYEIPMLHSYELPVVGVYVDPRVVPGFKYKVRPLDTVRGKYLFKGDALELQSIGRGYSRRITFQPAPNTLNNNDNYFWSDSRPGGYVFELEVLSVNDKFTVYDANHVPVGIVEIISTQTPQEEVGQTVLKDGTIEKTVRVSVLGKVEWYLEAGNGCAVLPITGMAVCTKGKRGSANVIRIERVTVGSHPRRGFTLTPGINNKLRSTVVKGANIGDVPTRYTIIGLEPYEMPVIGTYIDPRIVPGFEYRVTLAIPRRHLFQGRALRLVNIGMGYGKRITFAPDQGCLNENKNVLWSDSHPDGLGFEPRAVHVGQKFHITAGGLRLGEADVFRVDNPQIEDRQEMIISNKGTTIVKYIHIDVKCHVTMDTTGAGDKAKTLDTQVMRVSGTAVVVKEPKQSAAKLVRVENIGLDSQLNVLFVIQEAELLFHPI
uniref:Uncharacterized protein n=1 Tax=Clastoptera arizonana TaxID=38151 RepID=A0A1B6CT64_9HEMI